ncbi:MAG: beta-ketoacyl-ACP synthase III [Pseudomonadota bacterium]
MRRSVLLGCGSALPERVLTNDELSKMVDTSDEWIRERSGIRERRIAAEGETTADLAEAAARKALKDADLGPDDIDLVIIGTATPDLSFPSTAAIVQGRLGIRGGAAYDVAAACSGFVYALSVADLHLAAGKAERALVIGAETFSRILDWEDRGTCVLFGDGAGAFILGAEEQAGAPGDRGVLAAYLRSDGSFVDILKTDGGVSSTQTAGHVRMEGRKVFREAVNKISEAMLVAAAEAGVDVTEIDLFVPHQANQRIIDGVVQKLGLSPEGVVSTVGVHGNTSAASIPLAFDVAKREGRVKPGMLVMLEAMGGGLTWGAALIRI